MQKQYSLLGAKVRSQRFIEVSNLELNVSRICVRIQGQQAIGRVCCHCEVRQSAVSHSATQPEMARDIVRKCCEGGG
jgi:hypothetical protein